MIRLLISMPAPHPQRQYYNTTQIISVDLDDERWLDSAKTLLEVIPKAITFEAYLFNDAETISFGADTMFYGWELE